MSAIATQERLAKTTSWLAQLKVNAEYAGHTAEDAQCMSIEKYGKPLDELTVSEARDIACHFARICTQKLEAAKAARTPQNGLHSHPCFQCDGPVECSRRDCREAVSEHRHCHEGYTSSEWSTYHRKYGDGW